MVELAICLAAFTIILLMILEMVARIKYRITSRHLEVRLGGVCLRRVLLTDIERISKHRYTWCEAWPNTFRTRKRVLVITRRSGRVRYFLITPEQRYVFKHRLKQAMARARGEPEPADLQNATASEGEGDEDSDDD